MIPTVVLEIKMHRKPRNHELKNTIALRYGETWKHPIPFRPRYIAECISMNRVESSCAICTEIVRETWSCSCFHVWIFLNRSTGTESWILSKPNSMDTIEMSYELFIEGYGTWIRIMGKKKQSKKGISNHSNVRYHFSLSHEVLVNTIYGLFQENILNVMSIKESETLNSMPEKI